MERSIESFENFLKFDFWKYLIGFSIFKHLGHTYLHVTIKLDSKNFGMYCIAILQTCGKSDDNLDVFWQVPWDPWSRSVLMGIHKEYFDGIYKRESVVNVTHCSNPKKVLNENDNSFNFHLYTHEGGKIGHYRQNLLISIFK